MNKTTYPRLIDNPFLFGHVVRLCDVEVTSLERALIADAFQASGYVTEAQHVREAESTRYTPEGLIPDVKFANSPETGAIEGIDTSFGHRWTIKRGGGKYHLTDHKLGLSASADNLIQLKGAAVRRCVRRPKRLTRAIPTSPTPSCPTGHNLRANCQNSRQSSTFARSSPATT